VLLPRVDLGDCYCHHGKSNYLACPGNLILFVQMEDNCALSEMPDSCEADLMRLTRYPWSGGRVSPSAADVDACALSTRPSRSSIGLARRRRYIHIHGLRGNARICLAIFANIQEWDDIFKIPTGSGSSRHILREVYIVEMLDWLSR
jgi:hypothetical protein